MSHKVLICESLQCSRSVVGFDQGRTKNAQSSAGGRRATLPLRFAYPKWAAWPRIHSIHLMSRARSGLKTAAKCDKWRSPQSCISHLADAHTLTYHKCKVEVRAKATREKKAALKSIADTEILQFQPLIVSSCAHTTGRDAWDSPIARRCRAYDVPITSFRRGHAEQDSGTLGPLSTCGETCCGQC